MDSAAAIAARCESIGRNCEFGLIQRELGLEPVSLLRWAGMQTADLIRGLRSDWASIGENLEIYPAPRDDRERPEWLLDDAGYRMNFHVGLRPRDAGPELIAKAPARLRRLAEALMETIRTAGKVLVYSSGDFRRPEDGLELLAALREIGGGPVLIVAQGAELLPYPISHNAWGAQLAHLSELGYAGDVDRTAWHQLLRCLGPIIDTQAYTATGAAPMLSS